MSARRNDPMTKIQRILGGERVVVSHKDMDEIEGGLPMEALNRLVSVPNPGQCGVLDPLVAFLKPVETQEEGAARRRVGRAVD